ncbi:hypothetical protein [Adhaeribacter radiodurans]|uniref:Uncharacterized protein n=1 Tax=Adhaeribacter radiodurans TaxID=2745197 RepID=A0A7L7L4G1_9BACT|nr:hypothetical protein [Adhaeribacter radiodurans]QMU27698.1 hypothetical protein HUW48_06390 [Adhaeribacter radiodurans]
MKQHFWHINYVLVLDLISMVFIAIAFYLLTHEQIWVAISTLAAICLIAIIIFKANHNMKGAALIKNPTFEGAKDALERLSDWAKWLSGIQTAALGGLALLINNRPGIEKEPFVLVTALLFGVALICSAWVLSSLPSISLRIYATYGSQMRLKSPRTGTSKKYEIYELPFYHAFKGIPLSYVVTLQHWYWGIGILSFTWVLIQLPNYKPKQKDKASLIDIQINKESNIALYRTKNIYT